MEPGPLGKPLAPLPGRPPHKLLLLSLSNAWRIMMERVGVNIGRSTFYRWVESGAVFSFKIGGRLFIPWPELESVIRRYKAGERF